jgi:hypothetical protein
VTYLRPAATLYEFRKIKWDTVDDFRAVWFFSQLSLSAALVGSLLIQKQAVCV